MWSKKLIEQTPRRPRASPRNSKKLRCYPPAIADQAAWWIACVLMSDCAGAARPIEIAIEIMMRPRQMRMPARQPRPSSYQPMSNSFESGMRKKQMMAYSRSDESTPMSTPE